MECFKQKCRNNGSRTAMKTIYAGLIVLVLVLVDVPATLSNPDVRLSYDMIYNTTNYAQIPLNIQTESFSRGSDRNSYSYNHIRENTKDNNEIFRFNDKYEMSSNVGLLVGIAHDPFRESIPEPDYAKGVRTVNPESFNKDRGKRGVVHLYNMLTCATGCDPISYKGYGCYCGFLGSGRPTDGIDNCCKLHDECYEKVYCPFYTVYFQPYYWKCYHGQPLCALENYQTSNQVVNGCAGRLCECDRRFAMCVRKYSCPRGRPLCKSSPLRSLREIIIRMLAVISIKMLWAIHLPTFS